MRQIYSDKGFTLLETLIVMVLLSLATTLFLRVGGNQTFLSFLFSDRSAMEESVTALTDHILKIGRAASVVPGVSPSGCREANETTLQCSVDFKRPPTGDTTEVRFRLDTVSHTVFYETLTDEELGTWSSGASYRHIKTVTFCGDTKMDSETCPLLPRRISEQHAVNPTTENCFVRFHIVGALSSQAESKIARRPFTVQAAFFVRNPIFSDDSQVAYQFGTK